MEYLAVLLGVAVILAALVNTARLYMVLQARVLYGHRATASPRKLIGPAGSPPGMRYHRGGAYLGWYGVVPNHAKVGVSPEWVSVQVPSRRRAWIKRAETEAVVRSIDALRFSSPSGKFDGITLFLDESAIGDLEAQGWPVQ